MQPKLLVLLMTWAVGLLLSISPAVQAQTADAYTAAGLPAPTVTSDKVDYYPGEIAHISGSGWTLDLQVHVEFKETPDFPDFHIYDVTVDEYGNWQIDFPIEERHLGVTFTVVARGSTTGYIASTIFTDATWSLTLSRTVLCANTTTSLQFTVKQTNNSAPRNQSFTIVIPSGFTPSNPVITSVPTGKSWTIGLSGSTFCLNSTNGSTSQLDANEEIVFTADIQAPASGSGALSGRGNGTTTCSTTSGQAVATPPSFTTTTTVAAAPSIISPLCEGATSVSGTTTEANGTVIEVFVNSVSVGTTTSNNQGEWTKPVSALSAGAVVTAKAAALTKCTSALSSSVNVTPLPSVPTASAASDIGCTSFTANWNAADNATGYKLDVSTDNTFSNNGAYVNGFKDRTVSGTSEIVTGLTTGTTYYYRVRATNSCGTSASSTPAISVTTLPSPSTPTANAGSDVTCTSFTANWSAAADATAYRLDVATNGSFNAGVILAGYNNLLVSSTSQSVTGLTSGTTYFYRVRASNSCGTSTSSNTISVTTTSVPDKPGAISGPAIVCSGASSVIYSVEAVTGATDYTWTLPAGWSGSSTTNSITVTAGSTGQNGNITVTANNDCGPSDVKMMGLTVVAQPVAPVIAKNPDLVAVCEGTTLTINISTAGTGGTGTSQDEYRYSTDNGTNWSAWGTTIPSFASVAGTNLIESRRTSNGTGCNTSSSNQVSWTVAAQPEAPVIAKGSGVDVASVCAGQTLTISVASAGTGGVAGASQDEYRNSTDNGSNWSDWSTTLPSFAAITGTNLVESRRSSTGTGCTTDVGNQLSWTVVDQPVGPVIAKNPDVASVCAGQTLTISVTTAGTGGTGTSQDEYRYSTDNGGNWSSWGTALPSFVAVTGTNTVESRRSSTGTGCNEAAGSSVSWTVVAQPKAPYIAKGSSVNVSSVCSGTTLTISVTTAGSGGVSGADQFRYSTNNGSAWSSWSTTIPSFAAVTGTNIVESRRYADETGTGCTIAVGNSVSWTVYETPGISNVTNSSQSVQYSDPIANIVITGSPSNAVASAQTKKGSDAFAAGLPTGLSLVSNNDGTWTISGNANVAPAVYTIRVTLTNASLSTCTASTDITLTVAKEDACGTYNGTLFANTSDPAGGSTTIRLKVVVTEAADGNLGDVRNATVSFTLTGDITGTYTTTLDAAASTSTQATFYKDLTVSLSSSQLSKTAVVQWTIGGYYTNTNCTENTTCVTVSAPSADFLTGGGFLKLNSNPAYPTYGKYAGDAGSKNNFGFSVKWNKSYTNIQGGGINTIIRKGNYLYQVKGTKVTSLTVYPKTSTDPARAVFTCNAVVNTLDKYGAYISSEGNCSAVVELTDICEPGAGAQASTDVIAITVRDKNGVVVYSNCWDATAKKSVKQSLAGGNIQIHNASTTGAPTCTSAPAVTLMTRATEQNPELQEEVKFDLKVFPNPSTTQFILQLKSSDASGKIQLRVMDLMGRTIQMLNNLPANQTMQIGSNYRPGVYFIEMIQGKQKKVLKVTKQGD